MLAAVREDGRPADRSDLLEGDDTAALLDDDGAPDPEKVKAAVSELLAHKPHSAKRISGDVGQGTRPGPGDPNEERASYVDCIAGALFRSKYEAGLAAAGFAEVSVAFTHQVGDGLHSAIIKATKPVDTGQPKWGHCCICRG